MHLAGYYDMGWEQSLILLTNTSDRSTKIKAKFYDENGKMLHNTEPIEILPHGTTPVFLEKISQLADKAGLVVIECDPSVIAAVRWKSSSSGTRMIIPLSEGKLPFLSEGRSIFMSYAMKKENDPLYDLLSRFMKGLRFKVLSASETGKPDLPPGIQIKDMIKLSDSLLALLTKDIKTETDGKTVYHPSYNVIDEIGQAADKDVIMLVEEGTEVPSNLQTRATYLSFSREKTGDLIVNLLEAMQKQGLI